MGDCINIDVSNACKPDLVLDLSKEKLPYDDNSVDAILGVDFIEHIFNPIPVMNECWRVLKPGHTIYLETPLAGSNDFWKDPTHVRGFVEDTFRYFAEWNGFPMYGIKTWTIQNMKTIDDRIYVTLQKP